MESALNHPHNFVSSPDSPVSSSSSSFSGGSRKRQYHEMSSDSSVESVPSTLAPPVPTGRSQHTVLDRLAGFFAPLRTVFGSFASPFTSSPTIPQDAREETTLSSIQESAGDAQLDNGNSRLRGEDGKLIALSLPETGPARSRLKTSHHGEERNGGGKSVIPATQQLPSPQSSEDEAPRSRVSRVPVETKNLFENPKPSAVIPMSQREKPFRPRKQPHKTERQLLIEATRRRDFQDRRHHNSSSYQENTISRHTYKRVATFNATPSRLQSQPQTPVTRSMGARMSTLRRSQRLQRSQQQSGRVQKLITPSKPNPRVQKALEDGRLYYESIKEFDVLLEHLKHEKSQKFKNLELVERDRRSRQAALKELIAEEEKNDQKPKGVPALAGDQLKVVKETLDLAKRGPSNQVHASKNRLEISSKDMLFLRDNEWLNDEVINYYLMLICERGNTAAPNGPKKVFAFNTFFWSKLSTGGYKPVARWAKRQGVEGAKIKQLDYLFVPINMGNMHWVLSLVNLKQKRFEYYDSLAPGARPADVYKALRNYMQEESGGMNLDDWTDYAMKDPPRQFNGSDCGVFTVQTAEYISRGVEPSYSAMDIPTLRKKMVYEVLNGALLPRD